MALAATQIFALSQAVTLSKLPVENIAKRFPGSLLENQATVQMG